MIACRLIANPPASGAWNMAVDEALLVDAADNGVGTLRFYAWAESTLSLGYFQRYDDRQQHAASRECAIVRRQTGGGAILHDRELTYSLTLPAAHPAARQAEKLYAAVHEAFISALMQPIAKSSTSWRLVRHDRDAKRPVGQEPFLCFERRASGDVLLTFNGKDGNTSHFKSAHVASKILGSAQRRHRGAILQHGSLLLEKSPFAPELAGWRELTGVHVPATELIHALAVRLESVLSVRLYQSGISHELESKAAELTNSKYDNPAWTKRR